MSNLTVFHVESPTWNKRRCKGQNRTQNAECEPSQKTARQPYAHERIHSTPPVFRHLAVPTTRLRRVQPVILPAAAGIPIRGKRCPPPPVWIVPARPASAPRGRRCKAEEFLVQRDKIRLHFTGSHQVNTGEQNSIDVEGLDKQF